MVEARGPGGRQTDSLRRRLWYGSGPADPLVAVLSAALAPLEWTYRVGVQLRNAGYESGWLESTESSIPTLGVGNLTVGGTGKTPVTAWLARRLRERGRRPAVVMRGYGDDENAVHRVLNPDIAVQVGADRVSAVRRAEAAGADVVVLDDAFQHRRLRANAYLVLVAAEEWGRRRRMLPRGPWRERLSSLKRANLVAVTRKTASAELAAEIADELAGLAPGTPVARIALRVNKLASFSDRGESLESPGAEAGAGAGTGAGSDRCFSVGVAGVAHPEAVWSQLEARGVEIERRFVFPDHHRYTDRDVRTLLAAAAGGPIVATLKDAVKLRSKLSGQVELIVVLQEVVWEEGADSIEALLDEFD